MYRAFKRRRISLLHAMDKSDVLTWYRSIMCLDCVQYNLWSKTELTRKQVVEEQWTFSLLLRRGG